MKTEKRPGTRPMKSADSIRAGDPAIDTYLDEIWLSRGLSANTLAAYRRDLRALHADLNKPVLDATERDLLDVVAARYARGYKTRSSARWLSCIKGFYRHQVHTGRLSVDPAAHLEHPSLGRYLPASLSEQEVRALLQAPATDTALGLRDRAMLEVLYASGLRISELVSLRLGAVNVRQGVVRILGKGGKERLVPIGAEALRWVEQFVEEARSELVQGSPSDALFPSRRGRSASGMMPPTITGASTPSARSCCTSSGTRSRCEPDRIDSPITSGSSSRADATICSIVSRMPE